MEISDITKVASRKRINGDVEQLRNKVAKETAKIIKLKVAQDTVYWDLKEKLHQVEGNHERLQRNMLEVQMQHETTSGQYREELRLRSETLNKLLGTREFCFVLESYGARLKDTVGRCHTDQAALCAAYDRAGDALRALCQRAQRGDHAVRGLEHQVKLASEHQNQLLQVFSSSKQQLYSEIAELKSKLEAVMTSEEKLVSSVNEMGRKLDMYNFDIEKKEETITNLQRDIEQLIQDFNTQSIEAKKTLEKQEKDLVEYLAANTALKDALQSQELYIKNVSDQNIDLKEKMTSLEDQQANAATKIVYMKKQLEEAAVTSEKAKTDLRILHEEKVLLRTDLKEKEKLISSYEVEKQNFKSQIMSLVGDNRAIKSDLDKCTEESKIKTEHIEKLSLEISTLKKKFEETENSMKGLRETSDEKIKKLTSTIDSQNKELDYKASTITQLMSELKTSTDIRSKLETTIQRMKKEIDLEKEKVMEKERQQSDRIEQLEGVVRNKEHEVSQQMSIMLEIRDEKERLQEKIQAMKNTIDNIQKELTGRPAVVETRQQPDLDDNAVMMTPRQKKCQMPISPIITKKSEFLVSRKEPYLDTRFYTFSDSDDEDTLDTAEINRRFAAISRGERVSPLPLAAFKRRRSPKREVSLPLNLSCLWCRSGVRFPLVGSISPRNVVPNLGLLCSLLQQYNKNCRNFSRILFHCLR